MKAFKYILLIGAVSFQCRNDEKCEDTSMYIVKIDTSKPHELDGVYCINSVPDVALVQDNTGIVRIKTFERSSGAAIAEGSVWFTDELKYDFQNGSLEITLPPGRYDATVYPFDDHLALTIPGMIVSANRIVEVRCYLGSSLQY